MFRVKICGITNIQDALAVQSAGADALGMIFCRSPRQINAETAREISEALGTDIKRVGVFRDQDADEICHLVDYCKLDFIQLHGSETLGWADGLGLPYIKSINIQTGSPTNKDLSWGSSQAQAIILDNAGGGSGITFDWSLFPLFRALQKPLVLAGGLKTENVADAIVCLKPDAIDVGSGVEASPGQKDHKKINALMEAVQEGYRRLWEG